VLEVTPKVRLQRAIIPRKLFHIYDFTIFSTVQNPDCTVAQGL